MRMAKISKTMKGSSVRQAPENMESKGQRMQEKKMGYPAYTPKSDIKKKK
jgi:hypothetical protein